MFSKFCSHIERLARHFLRLTLKNPEIHLSNKIRLLSKYSFFGLPKCFKSLRVLLLKRNFWSLCVKLCSMLLYSYWINPQWEIAPTLDHSVMDTFDDEWYQELVTFRFTFKKMTIAFWYKNGPSPTARLVTLCQNYWCCLLASVLLCNPLKWFLNLFIFPFEHDFVFVLGVILFREIVEKTPYYYYISICWWKIVNNETQNIYIGKQDYIWQRKMLKTAGTLQNK